ncbi:MAG TPA: glycosyltransferase family 2 protein [Myxococcaceae bacterium]|nr:glycosyltransferase family 2 protein [Myxococcaceae bacterium]
MGRWREKAREVGAEALRELGRTLFRAPRVLVVRPVSDVSPRQAAGAWEATGSSPSFEIVSTNGALPRGWVLLHLPLRMEGEPGESSLLNVTGPASSEVVRLPPAREGHVRTLVRLPEQVESLQLCVAARSPRFTLGPLEVWEVGSAEATLRLAMPLVTRLAAEPERLPRAARKWWGVWRTGGMEGLKGALRDKSRGEQPLESYEDWIRQYDSLDDSERVAIRRRLESLPYQPLVSVVMPTYETPGPLLRRALDSVRRQLYPNWELCIADDASRSEEVRSTLAEYAREDPRIRYVVRSENGHISAASNSALELVRGEFIALLDHDDELSEHALACVLEELNAHPEADILYSDEDKLDPEGRRFDPYFKPDFSIELFRSQNLISHLGVYRTSLVREVGGFRQGLEGSQDHDLALRVVERVPAAHIRHLPRVLYHWRAIPGSTALDVSEKGYAVRAARRALEEHYARTGEGIQYVPAPSGPLHWATYPLPAERPLVSILMPTRDGGERLRRCIESIRERSTWHPFELLVVDNQSREPDTLAYLAGLAREGIQVIPYDAPFNYSAINNLAAAQARGQVLALLNDDLEIITPRWLEELVSHALRADVGAVGARLYYPDDTLQHAGIILGMGADGVAATPHRTLPRGRIGYFGRACLPQEFSAVTAACLVMRRSVFEEVGGFDAEHLPVAYNDVDLCLRLRERGYRIVWNPAAELYHHESATRGPEDTPEKRERFAREVAYMKHRWSSWLRADPFYNPNLALDRDDYGFAWPPRVQRLWR